MKDDTSTIGARLLPLGFKRYKDYLNSEHWRNVRRRYRESSLPQVCRCGATKVALHHKTYVRLGAEELSDLEPLCADCHRRAHGKKRRRKKRGLVIRFDPTLVQAQKDPRR